MFITACEEEVVHLEDVLPILWHTQIDEPALASALQFAPGFVAKDQRRLAPRINRFGVGEHEHTFAFFRGKLVVVDATRVRMRIHGDWNCQVHRRAERTVLLFFHFRKRSNREDSRVGNAKSANHARLIPPWWHIGTDADNELPCFA